MADPTLIANARAVGIIIDKRVDPVGGTTSDYYCQGGPNYDRRGRWVTVTTADTDGQKLTAIQTALS